METNYKIERKVRQRSIGGFCFGVTFANLSLIVLIIGCEWWNSLLIAQGVTLVLSVLIILLVLRILLYFLDNAIWRIWGVESLEINADHLLFVKKGRLLKRKLYIPMDRILSVERTGYEDVKAHNNLEDDKGKILIVFRKKIFGFHFTDQYDVGSNFTEEDVDEVLTTFEMMRNRPEAE